MNRLFNLSELEKKEVVLQKSNDAFLCEKYLNIHTEKIENIKFLTKELPGQNDIYFLWTLNSFNAFTFIPHIIRDCGSIDNIVISTYSINRRIVDSFINYIDKGKIKKVELYISDSLKVRMPRVVDHLNAMMDARKEIMSVNYVWNHSKITLIETCGNYFIIEGSGNWSENAKFEQYVFLNSKSVYDFRKSCINGTNS